MGIQQWVLRGAEAEVVPEVQPLLSTASLTDFPANTQGQFLIVCGPAARAEGQGSAFDGAAAQLLNAMLGATQWPASECVLLSELSQLDVAMQQVQPRAVIALGEAASQGVLQGSVQTKRQQLHTLPSSIAIASYHPVQAQHNPKQFKRPIWEDLKLMMAEIKK